MSASGPCRIRRSSRGCRRRLRTGHTGAGEDDGRRCHSHRPPPKWMLLLSHARPPTLLVWRIRIDTRQRVQASVGDWGALRRAVPGRVREPQTRPRTTAHLAGLAPSLENDVSVNTSLPGHVLPHWRATSPGVGGNTRHRDRCPDGDAFEWSTHCERTVTTMPCRLDLVHEISAPQSPTRSGAGRGAVTQAFSCPSRAEVRGHRRRSPRRLPGVPASGPMVTFAVRAASPLPRSELLPAHGLQVDMLRQSSGQGWPAAREPGMHHELVLIDQPQLGQRHRELRAPTSSPIQSCLAPAGTGDRHPDSNRRGADHGSTVPAVQPTPLVRRPGGPGQRGALVTRCQQRAGRQTGWGSGPPAAWRGSRGPPGR